jgi:hypothetical protein
MTVADGSQVRVAIIPEVSIGTIPATPAWATSRYLTSDMRISKQVDIPDEVRADANVSSITDVGRSVTGTLNGNLSYGTYDTIFESVMRSTWSTNVLVNGILHKTFAVEEFYEQGTTDTYIRYRGVRANTMDLTVEARKPVTVNFGVMGIDSPTPTAAIITGATYTAATTTDIFNGGLNVSGLTITGITNSPVMTKINLKLNSNLYQNDIVGQYAPYSHGLGRFEATGSISAYFETVDTYQAILNHTTVAIAFTMTDAAAKSYLVEIPKAKFLDGGPSKPGNGKAVMIEVPFQAFYDSGIAGSVRITRTP